MMAESGNRYSSGKERIAQAIFILFLIFGILLSIYGAFLALGGSVGLLGLFGPYHDDAITMLVVGALLIPGGAIPVAIGWGIRWLITGRSDKKII